LHDFSILDSANWVQTASLLVIAREIVLPRNTFEFSSDP